MKIYLHEITERETDLDFTQEDEWVKAAVLRVDERLEDARPTPFKRPVSVHFTLRKVDEVYVAEGRVQTAVELVCSRCATSFKYSCQPQFSALFCEDPVMSGIAHLYRPGANESGPARPMGQNHGFARHAHNPDEDESESSFESSKDLDITYLSQDHIDLGDVITEQLQLQIPFQPLCNPTCKGMCGQCGADLNAGRCACAKLAAKSPFAVLRDFKLPS